MTNILIICGHAQSGKSTLISELKEEGWGVASTSQILDQITMKIVNIFGDNIGLDLKAKRGLARFGSLFIKPRELKTLIAESIIVPILGREAMVRAAFKGIEQNYIVYESMGGEELDIAINLITLNYPDARVAVINMESAIQLESIDIRKLATPEQCAPYPVENFFNHFIGYGILIRLLHEYFAVN